jgi:acetyl esterase/lipase
VPSLEAGIDVPITLCTPPGAGGDAFLYRHGGGWIAPASGKHLGWAKRIAALSGQTVMAVHYRLAPEDRYPSALHDAVGAFRAMENLFTGSITAGGDSAGANLAAALFFFCCQRGHRVPEKLMLSCGVLDLELERHASMMRSGKDHPYNGIELLAFQRALYAPGRNLWTDPCASPAHRARDGCRPPQGRRVASYRPSLLRRPRSGRLRRRNASSGARHASRLTCSTGCMPPRFASPRPRQLPLASTLAVFRTV